jgi:hypothetical protein
MRLSSIFPMVAFSFATLLGGRRYGDVISPRLVRKIVLLKAMRAGLGADDLDFLWCSCNSRFSGENSRLGLQKFPFGLPRELARKQLIDNGDFKGLVAGYGKFPG